MSIFKHTFYFEYLWFDFLIKADENDYRRDILVRKFNTNNILMYVLTVQALSMH